MLNGYIKNKSSHDKFVFEIGSADGTALEEFKNMGIMSLG